MKFTWPIVVLFACRFLVDALTFPAADGDLAWQRWLGRSILATGRLPHSIGQETYTASGAKWIPHEWFFSLISSLSNVAAWRAIVIAAAASAFVTLVVGGVRATRCGAAPIVVAVVTTLSGIALFNAFGVRVQVFAWPLLALFLLLIEVDSPLAYGSIIIAIAWANIHASVMLAAPLAFAIAVGCYLDERWSTRTKRTLLVGLGSLAAVWCTPLTTALPLYAFSVICSPFKDVITEWKPPDLADVSFSYGALPILVALSINGVKRWSDRSVVVFMTVFMFSAVRNVPLFAITCAPIAARSLSAGIVSKAAAQTRKTFAERAAISFIAIGSVACAVSISLILVARSHALLISKTPLEKAIAAIETLPGSHRVFCSDYSWCSYLIGASHDRVFLDGRADPYPQAIWNDYKRIVSVRPTWDRVLRAHETDVVLVASSESLESVLELAKDWRSVYRNDSYRVWIAAASNSRVRIRHLVIRHPVKTVVL